MTEPIKKLEIYDLETIAVPDGYDLTSVPDLTRGNLQRTIDKVNELVERVNSMPTIKLED